MTRERKAYEPFYCRVKETGNNIPASFKIGPVEFHSFDDLIRFAFNPTTPKRRGTFRAVLKLNGGYGDNHDTGATVLFNWHGTFRKGLKDVGILTEAHRTEPIFPPWYCLLCGTVVINIENPGKPPESCHCGCREFGFAGKAEGGISP